MNEIMWHPSDDRIQKTQISKFCQKVSDKYGIQFSDYQSLHRWSVEHISDFWEMIWNENNIIHSRNYTQIVDDDTKMTGAKWLSGVRLNFAENLLRFQDERTAILFKGEDNITNRIS